ncbi:hypothetical protein A3A79_04150 [Candidatus Gottesmanbacteria bacterium RIFCSPLOWO2_01_FULL_43_11b]|uniref:Addiction module toxin RelE n=1 Tax=Candidatus Gottesmanbacteria bacterium RIFCSPLOWO2_01_FULL_43_11b TaxID=1798392 RepID=A0A1F6AHY6_9BACT|nr:MAG: hypothetical protein A3A79_04150 [Candidatus Gottesmanbacteria bacterium RIFCSPLOWO2_01_FULL_43_11b]
MNVTVDHRVKRFLDKLNKKERAKAFGYIEFFEDYGFTLDQRYLKKVKNHIWELRPGRIRLFVFVRSTSQIVIHAFIKKSQKIKKEDLVVIEQRGKEYL